MVQDDRAVQHCVEAVTRFLDAPDQNIDLPLDARGTAFQRRVWTALRRLKTGTTTYSDPARRIGQPRAVRAVARGSASNAIALAIPCHRVIRGDGSLSGYAGASVASESCSSGSEWPPRAASLAHA